MTTSDQPGSPMRPGAAGTASAGFRVPAPRSPQPPDTDPAPRHGEEAGR